MRDALYEILKEDSVLRAKLRAATEAENLLQELGAGASQPSPEAIGVAFAIGELSRREILYVFWRVVEVLAEEAPTLPSDRRGQLEEVYKRTLRTGCYFPPKERLQLIAELALFEYLEPKEEA